MAAPKLSFVLFVYPEPNLSVSALYISFLTVLLCFPVVFFLFDIGLWLKVKVNGIDVRCAQPGWME